MRVAVQLGEQLGAREPIRVLNAKQTNHVAVNVTPTSLTVVWFAGNVRGTCLKTGCAVVGSPFSFPLTRAPHPQLFPHPPVVNNSCLFLFRLIAAVRRYLPALVVVYQRAVVEFSACSRAYRFPSALRSARVVCQRLAAHMEPVSQETVPGRDVAAQSVGFTSAAEHARQTDGVQKQRPRDMQSDPLLRATAELFLRSNRAEPASTPPSQPSRMLVSKQKHQSPLPRPASRSSVASTASLVSCDELLPLGSAPLQSKKSGLSDSPWPSFSSVDAESVISRDSDEEKVVAEPVSCALPTPGKQRVRRRLSLGSANGKLPRPASSPGAMPPLPLPRRHSLVPTRVPGEPVRSVTSRSADGSPPTRHGLLPPLLPRRVGALRVMPTRPLECAPWSRVACSVSHGDAGLRPRPRGAHAVARTGALATRSPLRRRLRPRRIVNLADSSLARGELPTGRLARGPRASEASVQLP